MVLSLGKAGNLALNEAQVSIHKEPDEIFAGFQGTVDDLNRIATIQPVIMKPTG